MSILSAPDNLIAISPSGIDYNDVTVADVVVVDRSGKVVDGERKPSSELGFHLALYAARPEDEALLFIPIQSMQQHWPVFTGNSRRSITWLHFLVIKFLWLPMQPLAVPS